MASSSDTFQVVRVYDPAIDHDTPEDAWRKFLNERDHSGLVYFDGKKPVVFHCRPLSIDERRQLRSCATEEDKHEAAFARGVVRVERHVHPDGDARDFYRPTDTGAKARPIPDSMLALFGEEDVQEIGAVVLARSFLARDRPASYRLLATSLHALAALRLHRAAAMNATSPSAETKPQAEAQPPATPSASPAGGESGGATATGSRI